MSRKTSLFMRMNEKPTMNHTKLLTINGLIIALNSMLMATTNLFSCAFFYKIVLCEMNLCAFFFTRALSWLLVALKNKGTYKLVFESVRLQTGRLTLLTVQCLIYVLKLHIIFDLTAKSGLVKGI